MYAFLFLFVLSTQGDEGLPSLFIKQDGSTNKRGLETLETPEQLRDYLKFKKLNHETIESIYNEHLNGASFSLLSHQKLRTLSLQLGPRMLCLEIIHSLELDPSFDFTSLPSFARNYSSVGDVVRQIGSFGEDKLQFDWPRGMSIDEKERIFVADEENNRIQCFDSEGLFLFTFGSFGKGKGYFDGPTDVALDHKNQRILVADTGNHRIQIFDLEGDFLFSFGSQGNGNGEFSQPYGIAIDRGGNIYVSDRDNHRIQVFDQEGTFLRKFGSEGRGKGDLKEPYGIGLFSNGDVIVAEAAELNQRLSIFNSQGRFVRFLGEGKVKNPLGIFVDSEDNILVTENSEVERSLLVFGREGILLKQIGFKVFERSLGVVMNGKGEIFVSGRGRDGEHCIFVF